MATFEEHKKAAVDDLYGALQAINLSAGTLLKAKHPELAERMWRVLAKAEGRAAK